MRRWELLYPYIFALLAGIPVAIFQYNIFDVKNFSSILNAAVTVSSIIIAFLATMISILITLSNAEVMKQINNKDAEGLLTSYIKTAIVSGLLLAMYSILLYLFLDLTGLISNLLLTFFTMLITFFILSSYRIIDIVSRVLAEVMKENKPADQSKKVFKPKSKTGEENHKS
jgi:ABC-type spermidine/putrescine transport system permease subunit I